MVAQVQRRVGTTMRIKGRPPFPIPGTKVRDRLVRVMVSAAGVPPVSDGFILGTTKPDATNTGPRIPFASAQVVMGTNGKITYSTAGQVVSGKVFYCQPIATAPNITFRDNWYFGSTILKYLGAPLLDMSGAANCRVEFSEFAGFSGGQDRTRYWLNAVKTGPGSVVYRNNMHDVTDGISMGGVGVQILGNFIHDLTFRSDDADHKTDTKLPWRTHNDCIQFSDSADSLVDGNMLSARFSTQSGMIGSPTAAGITSAGVVDPALNHGTMDPAEWPNAHALLIGPRNGPITNLQVNRNWIDGGNYGIQITTQGKGYDSGNSGSFSGNRIYSNQTGSAAYNPAQILVAAIGTFTGLGTTIYADDDLSVAAGWRGKPIQTPSSGGTYRFSSSLTPPN